MWYPAELQIQPIMRFDRFSRAQEASEPGNALSFSHVKRDVLSADVIAQDWLGQCGQAIHRAAYCKTALRDEHGFSQMDMVRDHGWNLSHYQKLERGVLDPKLSTLVRLAKDFGITLAELLTDF